MSDESKSSDLLSAIKQYTDRGGKVYFWVCPYGCRDGVTWNHGGGKHVAKCNKCGKTNSR